jgi:hypothetical protein
MTKGSAMVALQQQTNQPGRVRGRADASLFLVARSESKSNDDNQKRNHPSEEAREQGWRVENKPRLERLPVESNARERGRKQNRKRTNAIWKWTRAIFQNGMVLSRIGPCRLKPETKTAIKDRNEDEEAKNNAKRSDWKTTTNERNHHRNWKWKLKLISKSPHRKNARRKYDRRSQQDRGLLRILHRASNEHPCTKKCETKRMQITRESEKWMSGGKENRD